MRADLDGGGAGRGRAKTLRLRPVVSAHHARSLRRGRALKWHTTQPQPLLVDEMTQSFI